MDGPHEGCLAVREAWLSVAKREHDREFLEGMLLCDPEIRTRLRRELGARIAFAPQINAAVEQARGPGATPVERVARWQLVLLGLPQTLKLAFCRSLRSDLADVTEDELRVALIGEDRDADVLPFRGRP